MSNINSAFTIKNDHNTLGRILSGGTDLVNIFPQSTLANTYSANWQSVYSNVNNVSSNWQSVYNNVNSLSTNWNSVYSYTGSVSANNASIYTLVSTTTGASQTFNVGNLTASLALKGATVNATTGYLYNSSGGTTGQVLRSNGTNYVGASLVASDLPTLIPNTTVGTAGALSATNTIWGQNFNGTQNVTGSLTNVGTNITGAAGITIASGNSTNGNIAITPDGSGTVNISKSNITGGNINATTIGGSNPAAGTFTNLSQSNGTLSINPNAVGAINNVNIGENTAGTGKFSSVTVVNNATVGGDLNVGGTLYLQGSAIYENSNSLVVKDPVIYLAEDSPGDNWDIGIVGHTVTSNGYGHTGLLRGHPSTFNAAGSAVGTWYLFSSMVLEPSSNNVANNPKVIDTLIANTSGTHTGNASTATALAANTTFNFYGGDLYSPSSLYNGTQNISFAPILSANTVTYSKIQQVAANSLLGNNTGSPANVAAIAYSTTGLSVLQGTAAQGATALALGTTDSPTFQGVVTTGSSGSAKTLAKNYYASGTSSTPTITTVPVANYSTAKFLVRFVNTGSSAPTNQSGVAEILAHYDGANWNYTIYGFIDPYSIIQNTATGITVSASTTLDINFTFLSSYTYSISVYCLALI
jgi:hypothetical protein